MSDSITRRAQTNTRRAAACNGRNFSLKAGIATVLLGLVSLSTAADAMDDRLSAPTSFNIPAQPLGVSLKEFADQAGVQILFEEQLVAGLQAPAVETRESPLQALRDLLRGTGLDFVAKDRTIAVRKKSTAATASLEQDRQGSAGGKGQDYGRGGSAGGAQTPSSAAQVDNSGSAAGPTLNPDSRSALEEVIVTASKRPERLREVAGSVTAFTGAELQAMGAQSFQDYLSQAPGVIFQAATPGVSNVTIRGIGTATASPDQGQSTTGIYLNDIPLTDPGFAMAIPDLDVFDVQRVEVLKGPQGTLFGSATLGGAVNYILNPVSLTQYQALAEAGISHTQNSSQIGYEMKGAVNLPLIENVFGVRLSVADRRDPGFLDNIGIGVPDSNTHEVFDWRLNALWQINERFSLDFFSFHDDAYSGDGFYAAPALGDLKRDTFVAETATFLNEIESLKLNGDLGFANLSATAAYSHKSQVSQADFTAFYGGVPTASPAFATDESEMGEVRLTSPTGKRLEWLGGVYFGHFNEAYPTPTDQNGVDVYDFSVWYNSKEAAAFGEATYHFTDQWRLTFGGRYYHETFFTETSEGVPGTPYSSVAGNQTGNGFSPKGSITFEPTSNFLLYGLVSRGFRMGGVNLLTPLPGFSTPTTYKSDSLINYELGVRTSWLDKTLLLDTTLFYIDWSDIQIRLNRPDDRSYATNAGAARSEGVETTISWKPSAAFDLQVGLTYLDAELTQSVALGGGETLESGSAIPGASKWSSSETATYHVQLPHSPYLAVTHRYLSGSTSAFMESLPVGDYNTLDFRTGAEFGNVGVAAFVTNLADKRGITAAQYFGSEVQDFYIRPRTVGLRVNWRL
jgi:iron complex outermembrane recepter protein